MLFSTLMTWSSHYRMALPTLSCTAARDAGTLGPTSSVFNTSMRGFSLI